MEALQERISAEFAVLVGQPLTDWGRVANLHLFGFGPLVTRRNRKGDLIQASPISLHVQCHWRIVDGSRILFGSGDLNRPADEGINLDDFDGDIHPSVLDERLRAWIAQFGDAPLRILAVQGDRYGGFRIEMERGYVLEAFPCDSTIGKYSEHWRLFGHRPDDSHFVVTGDGVEGEG